MISIGFVVVVLSFFVSLSTYFSIRVWEYFGSGLS